jgi:hypothetical protein
VKLKDEIDWYKKIFIIFFKTLSLHVKKNLELNFDYNFFSFKLLSFVISSQFFRKSIFDLFNDIDLFDLKVRLFSSFNEHVLFKQLISNKSLTHREFNRFVIMKENIKMIFLFEITWLKDSFEYQTWQKEIKNQLIFMNFWHYVEIENVKQFELIDSILIAVVSISIIFEKFRKIKINNFKVVMIMKNRLKCNDKNLLKNEINAKNARKILKNSFSSFESKILNDLLIKF